LGLNKCSISDFLKFETAYWPGLVDNSPTNQLAVSQVVGWSTR